MCVEIIHEMKGDHMKRILSLGLCVLMLFSLAACGEKEAIEEAYKQGKEFASEAYEQGKEFASEVYEQGQSIADSYNWL